MTGNALMGTWRLVSLYNEAPDGDKTYPFGRDPLGYIAYTPQQRVLVSVMHPHRQAPSSNDLLAGSIEEKAAAHDRHVSYAGRYDLLPDRVIHHIEVSSLPQLVGTSQTRFFTLEGDRLTLDAPPLLIRGVYCTQQLIWERVI